MKRSRQVPLVLLGAIGTGALLTACAPRKVEAVSAQRVYLNNQYIAGVGYFHAPFAEFFPRPLNDFDVNNRLYFVGGRWQKQPLEHHVNVAAPSPAAAERALRAQQAEIVRSGFGQTGHSRSIYS